MRSMDHSALVCRCTLLTHPRTRLSFPPSFPLFRGARVDETTPKCAHPAVGMKLVLRAPLLVMSAETVYGASATLSDTLLGAHGKNPYLTVSVPHPHMKTLSVSLSSFFRVRVRARRKINTIFSICAFSLPASTVFTRFPRLPISRLT